jgi:hypothetical protein
VIENAKDLITKEKASKFKSQCQKDQLSTALEIKEHRSHTLAISSIASWKEGFTEDIHIYKKRGRHDTDVESANNDEGQFATQFFNFMRIYPDIIICQVSVPQINLDISIGFTLSNAGSTLDHQKYPVDDINEPTPCTLFYVIVADAIVMTTHIIHGWLVLSECVVVKVTTIR